MIKVENILSITDEETVVLTGAQLKELITSAMGCNALTGLPGNAAIASEVEKRITSNDKFAVIYCDLDNFKPYNDKYGFDKGDLVLKLVAEILKHISYANNSFVGHIGGDDFIVVTEANKAKDIAEEIADAFDKMIPLYYSKEDQKSKYIKSQNRKGEVEIFSIMALSMGIVTNENRGYTSIHEVSDIATEVKKVAKKLSYKNKKSCYFIDRRRS